MECTCCNHKTSIVKYFPDTGIVACRVCQDLGIGTPKLILRGLGFLLRSKCETWPMGRLKSKATALIEHDRALLDAAPVDTLQQV